MSVDFPESSGDTPFFVPFEVTEESYPDITDDTTAPVFDDTEIVPVAPEEYDSPSDAAENSGDTDPVQAEPAPTFVATEPVAVFAERSFAPDEPEIGVEVAPADDHHQQCLPQSDTPSRQIHGPTPDKSQVIPPLDNENSAIPKAFSVGNVSGGTVAHDDGDHTQAHDPDHEADPLIRIPKPRETPGDLSEQPPELAPGNDSGDGMEPPDDRLRNGDSSEKPEGEPGRMEVARELWHDLDGLSNVPSEVEFRKFPHKIAETLGNRAQLAAILEPGGKAPDHIRDLAVGYTRIMERLEDEGVQVDSTLEAEMYYAGIQLDDKYAPAQLETRLKDEQDLVGLFRRAGGHNKNLHPLLTAVTRECERSQLPPNGWIDNYATDPLSRWQLYAAHYRRLAQLGDADAQEVLHDRILEFIAGMGDTFLLGAIIGETPALLKSCKNPDLQDELIERFIAAQGVLLGLMPDMQPDQKPNIPTFYAMLDVADQLLPHADVEYDQLWWSSEELMEMPPILALDRLMGIAVGCMDSWGDNPAEFDGGERILNDYIKWMLRLQIHFGAEPQEILQNISDGATTEPFESLGAMAEYYAIEGKYEEAGLLLGVLATADRFNSDIFKKCWSRAGDNSEAVRLMAPSETIMSQSPYVRVLYEDARAIASRDPNRLIQRLLTIAEIVQSQPDETDAPLGVTPHWYVVDQCIRDFRNMLYVLGEADPVHLPGYIEGLLPIMQQAGLPLSVLSPNVLGIIAKNGTPDVWETVRSAIKNWPEDQTTIGFYLSEFAVQIARQSGPIGA